MGIAREHELHRRRFSRNIGLGIALGAFALLVFALTLVKVQAPPHQPGAEARPLDAAAEARP